MEEKIMYDNILYLQEWMRYNPNLKDNLTIDGKYIYCKINNELQKQDISQFYLPEMLYNEKFRSHIAFETEINAIDLFKIIKLYCQTKEILEKEQKELQQYPYIKDIKVMKDKENKEFILLIDEYNKKYRYDTNTPEKIINLYNDLKEKRHNVTLKELGRVIQNAH